MKHQSQQGFNRSTHDENSSFLRGRPVAGPSLHRVTVYSFSPSRSRHQFPQQASSQTAMSLLTALIGLLLAFGWVLFV